MKIQILQESLKEALGIAGRAVSSNSSLTTLRGVLLRAESGRFTLSASNLSLGLVVETGAKIEEDGAVVVPFAQLYGLVSKMTAGPIELEAKRADLTVRTEKIKSEIKGWAVSEFPLVKEAPEEGIVIPADTLREMIEQTVYCAESDGARPTLGTICLNLNGDVQIVCTDGFRLVAVNAEQETGVQAQLLIPAREAAELARILKGVDEVVLTLGQPGLLVKAGHINANLGLIEDKYPAWHRFVPIAETYTTVEFDPGALRTATERAASVFSSDEKAKHILFKIRDDGVSLEAKSSNGDYSETITASVEGDGLDVILHGPYVVDLLRNAPQSPTLRWRLTAPNSPTMFFGEHWQAILMPAWKKQEEGAK